MERLGLLAALIMASQCYAQNLVPNGSFEEYIDCPMGIGYWSVVVGWTSPFTGSADYYNACAGGLVCSVPLNTAGYQYPADGDAYMGIITYTTLMGGYYREILAVQLTESLQPGIPVYISYKVSPGGFGSSVHNSATWAAKGPGLNFFTELPSDWQTYLFPNGAAVEIEGVLADTSSWTKVSGIYIPDSAYSWLAIANFYENDSSQAQMLDNEALSDWAYAFIDDVCVSYDETFCVGSVGVDSNEQIEAQFTANLADGILRIWSTSMRSRVHMGLCNLEGKVIWVEQWDPSERSLTVSLPGLSPGIYILKSMTSDGQASAVRLVHSSTH